MTKVIHWFRQDLRLSDNPSLAAAAKHGAIMPLYILDDSNFGDYSLGAASRCWLHYSLHALDKQLDGKLIIQQGDPMTILQKLIKKHDIAAVYWNRCYEPWQIKRDKKLKATLQAHGIRTISENASLLWEPWEIKNKQGENYKVFTPFYRKGCLGHIPPRTPIQVPRKPTYITDKSISLTIEDLALLPTTHWDKEMMRNWSVGEEAAKKRLQQFIRHGLAQYKEGRNFPAKAYTSRLSPHLHWGEISPNQIWYTIKKLPQDENTDCFLSELGWREFSYSLLYYYPSLPKENLQQKFNNFPWQKSKKLLNAWQQGLTGYPIVDAGMRELWQTGYMHNRVRMIVGSFLVKNLRHHWHEGEKWFWDCLVDADLAANSASWQWVAGCGADAAPYFRIFNPVTQAEKFDPSGEYIKRYIPELAKLPKKYLFVPWKAPEKVLQATSIKLSKTYPMPIVELASSREQALAAFKSLA